MHPLVKRVLDGELTLDELPPELRAEAERAQHLLGAVDRTPVVLPPAVEQRIMDAVRRRVATPRPGVSPPHRGHRWRWAGAGALAAAATVTVLLVRAPRPPVPAPAVTAYREAIRFVFHDPDARAVALAGTFNDWNLAAAPLTRRNGGEWTITVSLAPGQHEYAFVIDGRRWRPDPSAPTVDDGFGRRNSVIAVSPPGQHL